jgi:hypothetical protein
LLNYPHISRAFWSIAATHLNPTYRLNIKH